MQRKRLRFTLTLILSLILLILAGGYLLASSYSKKGDPVKVSHNWSLMGLRQETIAAPTNLQCITGDNKVDLSWNNPDSKNVKYFFVYRWLQGETPTVVARLSSDITTWSDATAANGVKYFYMVVSVGKHLQTSGVEAQITGTPEAPPPPPPPPVEPEPVYYDDYDYDYYYEEPAPAPAPAPDPPPDDGGCDPPPDDGGGGG